MNRLDEAVQFFRGERSFHRLFCEMKKKYESLGRIGGAISVTSFSTEEKEAIASFFGKEMSRVSLAAFEQQLTNTRFAGISLIELLEHYFGEPFVTKKEQQIEAEREKEAYFTRLMHTYRAQRDWLIAVEKQRFVQLAYQQNPQTLETAISVVCRALEQLPSTYVRLPVFAQQVANDPHALDLHTLAGKLLLSALQFYAEKEYDLSSVEEVNELLQSCHLLREDVLNFVTCAGVLAETEKGRHLVFAAACETNTALNVPLREVMPLVRAYPSIGNTVFIVENAGVFSTLVDTNVPLISTNGQLNLATMWLLDLLVKEGVTLYYSGDFDPEGLKMAQRLVERYGSSVRLWHYDRSDYLATKPTVPLPDERLAKLQSVTLHDLQPVKQEMLRRKKAGYQEAIVEELRKDTY
ncbi:DNA topoisomerase IV subunit A with TOPRIM domain [Anoxybacillus flavithermus NBRC 109594]|uniref:DNA topoisomerase IV subunit A with TOPRIM domain n=1 Tax=Anoxybacillus flavithermus NBRC 109594 TaxID=1315967 RepID=R4G736_9BACL|nr:TIGR02679 family protein [Anoxybacillus flavithermus]GAC91997.1 DNA topoisomerase IV subunit A with TOPRIM domain [Anoxybacillus flavithermus NBRC 109594]